MNIKPNLYTGIGLGMMAASVILGLIHLNSVHKNSKQITVLDTQIHTLQKNNQQLHQQLSVLRQASVSHAKKNTKVNTLSNRSTLHSISKGKVNVKSPSSATAHFVTVLVYPGMSVANIASLLSRSGIITSPETFIIQAIKYNRPLRAGKFTFQVNESISKILYKMATN